jgi:hypothetical protein
MTAGGLGRIDIHVAHCRALAKLVNHGNWPIRIRNVDWTWGGLTGVG